MYRKKSRGWYKHKDFILIDLICLFLSLLIAHLIRNGSVQSLFRAGIYRNMISFVILADLFLIIIFESYKGVLRRGHYQELHSVIRQMILLELASGLYLFTVSDGHSFSRTVLYLMGVFYVFLSYGTRIAWKKHLIHKMAEGGEHSLYIVTNYDQAAKVIRNVKEHNYNRYNINGLIIVDKNAVGRKISGIPVVAELENAASYICQQWVDEVFVNIDESYSYPDELIQELLEMGMVVHVNLAKVKSTSGQKQFVETVGGYTVLTTTMNYATDRQAFAKRALDILGGLVGCFLTGIIFIFVAPAIYISSPGPIFFSQTRIGQNGKPFKMYKFRSMYMDAEERKAELMAQNKMSDGRMFKLDFDPRVIGNKILPDGSRKTGIGEFIRKTSLDEFPQFWNVLNGTMSLVGTRPILQDELLKYELHHRARIAIKPGITGISFFLILAIMDINVFYLIPIEGNLSWIWGVYRKLLLVIVAFMLFVWSKAWEHTTSFMKNYVVAMVTSLSIIVVTSVLRYDVNPLKYVLLEASYFLLIFLAFPIYRFMVRNGKNSFFSTLNIVAFIWYVICIMQVLIYSVTGNFFLYVDHLFRNDNLRFSLKSVGCVMVVYNFCKIWTERDKKIGFNLLQFCLGMYCVFFIQQTRAFFLAIGGAIVAVLLLYPTTVSKKARKNV